MKRQFLAACSIVAMSGFGLSAQQPQPQPAPQTPPTQQTPPSQPAQRPPDPSPSPTSQPPDTRSTSPSSEMAKTATTVTGCLKTWDSRTMAPATGAGSGAGSAASPVGSAPSSTGASGQFVLTNIERTGAAARGGASSFLLKTSDSGVSFSQHLNHRVEVTGTLSDSGRDIGSADKPTSDKPSADRDASASGRVSAADMKLPTLDVTALKMVAPTCGTGSN
jgi:hypothetical protein